MRWFGNKRPYINKSFLYANLQLMVLSLAIYIINSKFKNSIEIKWIRNLCNSYINDFVGAVFYIAVINHVCYYFLKGIIITRIVYIELILLLCGIVWEYITPLFREGTVSDIIDIIVYLVAGMVYWFIAVKNNKTYKPYIIKKVGGEEQKNERA